MNDNLNLDEISMRSGLYKPDDLFGMEPFLGIVSASLAVMLIFVYASQLSYLVAALIVGVGFPVLRRQGKIDLQYTSVILRTLIVKGFYPPTSYVGVKRPPLRKQQRDKRG